MAAKSLVTQYLHSSHFNSSTQKNVCILFTCTVVILYWYYLMYAHLLINTSLLVIFSRACSLVPVHPAPVSRRLSRRNDAHQPYEPTDISECSQHNDRIARSSIAEWPAGTKVANECNSKGKICLAILISSLTITKCIWMYKRHNNEKFITFNTLKISTSCFTAGLKRPIKNCNFNRK